MSSNIFVLALVDISSPSSTRSNSSSFPPPPAPKSQTALSNPLFSRPPKSPNPNPLYNLEHLFKKCLTNGLFCLILWS